MINIGDIVNFDGQTWCAMSLELAPAPPHARMWRIVRPDRRGFTGHLVGETLLQYVSTPSFEVGQRVRVTDGDMAEVVTTEGGIVSCSYVQRHQLRGGDHISRDATAQVRFENLVALNLRRLTNESE